MTSQIKSESGRAKKRKYSKNDLDGDEDNGREERVLRREGIIPRLS